MRRYYDNDAPELSFAAPSTLFAVLGAVLVLLGAFFCIISQMIAWAGLNLFDGSTEAALASSEFLFSGVAVLVLSLIPFTASLVMHAGMSDADKIAVMARKRLCLRKYGNPLALKDGELLPSITCNKVSDGVFELTVGTESVTAEKVLGASSSLSSSLVGRYKGYAIIMTDTNISKDVVKFTIEDVMEPHGLTFKYIVEMMPNSPTELIVQRGTTIDLKTSGSMLFAGKTRSGKTTAIISILLQVLLMGPDEHGSQVVIIDPKKAELGVLPHVVTPDKDGDSHAILEAMRSFARSVTERQAYLNELSTEKGDVVKWWDAEMHPSFLFIDEFVAMQTLLPQRASKDDPDYSLKEFEGILKRILTMGASAGCFAIISIAEASVESGGLPTMFKSAMSTKALFRPTLPEARLIWDAEKTKDMPERVYGPGEAWFSSTDGVHDSVSYVHFPQMEFPAYAELGRLLMAYNE